MIYNSVPTLAGPLCGRNIRDAPSISEDRVYRHMGGCGWVVVDGLCYRTIWFRYGQLKAYNVTVTRQSSVHVVGVGIDSQGGIMSQR